MTTHPLAAAALAAALLSTQGAAAAHGRDWDDEDDDAPARDLVYAQVLESRPIYREVRVSAPRQECYNERVVVRDRYDGGDRVLGTVIGGVVGGAIGHQFGGGSGKKVATAVGAVIGAQAGHDYAERHGDDGYTRDDVRYEQRCRTFEDSRYESRIDAYAVTYRYGGRTYQTELPYDPGRRLPVRVDITPLRN